MINYFSSNAEIRDAWFKFKKKYPHKATSVISFVAGYNASSVKIKDLIIEIKKLKESFA